MSRVGKIKNKMPIYEYQCTECDHITEEIESFKSVIKTIMCPFCNGISNRILSLGSFHLKGGGWYKDGYGDKKSMSKEEKIERSTVKTTSTNSKTGESKVVSERPLDAKTPEARSLVDD